MLTAEKLCLQLGISQQTLRRRLTAEDTSYQQIKNNLRSDLSMKLLFNRSLSITAVVNRMDFSEPLFFFACLQTMVGLHPKKLSSLESQMNRYYQPSKDFHVS
jgi:AraC-like DNA-binding protein